MLGVIADGLLHIRFARHHEYLVALPAIATCKSCGAINRLNPIQGIDPRAAE
jgi:hypothetical protein